ncbi:penicillin acylase family protein [Nafulsella turpanensis]|uniref:penicillin acylase family protein n=1 Tax=Nafulsella turpanensis TaxID=1265690 RepID=UPI000476E6F4|nr:penicillin acylase family protein [Nafulsella turpanensis]
MRLLKFSVSFIITVIFLIVLNNRLGTIPPLGKFLDPFNGFYRNAKIKEDHFLQEKLALPGLQEEVRIQYDEFLVPHITAANNHDLYYAQGYVTAMHRLWQMELQTHFAAGRLSEIFGESMLERDRLMRRKGLRYGAENSLRVMEQDPEVKEALAAYSRGINDYIRQLDFAELPFEYKLLDYRPEEWSPLKSALLLKYMANDLAGRDYDLENTNIVKLFGKETFDLLFPERLPNTDPIIPEGTPWKFKPEAVTVPEKKYPSLFTKETIAKPEKDNGSNNWAVSGEKTRSGNPMLANDPHLQLNLPSIWYALQLTNPDANTYGVSLPGAPGIIIGFNDSIAWGVTNATRDVMDWYAIRFKTDERDEYEYDGKWLKTEERIEKIKVRPGNFWQGEEIQLDTVIYTHHGPVVYDEAFPGDSAQLAYALRWTAHSGSNELKTFLQLNRAHNYQEFEEALIPYQAPAQNFVFASVAGTIAMWVQGKFPLKWKEQGKFLMDGSRREHEWQGYIPQMQNAHIVNPKRGFVSSANQMPVGSGYPYYTYDQNYQHYRNRRINQILAKMDHITLKDMMQLQNDNFNLKAKETLPWMLDSLEVEALTNEQQRAFKMLNEWDYLQLAKAKAPALYEAWWSKFRELLWDEFSSLNVAVIEPDNGATVALLQKDPTTPFIDNRLTPEKENLNDLLHTSFALAVEEIEKWEEEHEEEASWGNIKNSSIKHLSQQDALSVTDLQVDGGRDIVNANSGRHGASWRMVVELSQPIQAFGVYPGGQSGNPGSPFYSNFIESWRKGEYNPLYFINEQQSFEDKIIFTQTLYPEP